MYLFMGGLLIITLFALFIFFSTKTGRCKCISEVNARSPSGDQVYQSIEAKDNVTFCGFEKDGYRYGCKPSDCNPVCT